MKTETIIHFLIYFHPNNFLFHYIYYLLCKKFNTIKINLIYNIIKHVIFFNESIFNKLIIKLYNYVKE